MADTNAPTPSSPLSTNPPASKPDKPEIKNLTLIHHKGDLFNAPSNTVLLHACNTLGSWGAGIALAFRARYPKAYLQYRTHCLTTHDPKTAPVPTGTCLLIPPCETDPAAPRHWIGCLFTSAKYGRAKDEPEVILANTRPAMRDCLEQVRKAVSEGKEVGGVRMCRINSARFGVPWERTVDVLEGITVEEGWVGDVEVWSID
ncbi:hypothetical protein CC78DRAFT_535728 [Lojkania enalia]|uniref:ADP-ribose 1''-phosphate phosphatase n=1 Tax=Lojkania enalia TaxID=147567 RepID=A0A9P4N0H0_9PLEO|nr:hypothetical protein CC78DRAFT_535728 [Didymosphaeria enalia]